MSLKPKKRGVQRRRICVRSDIWRATHVAVLLARLASCQNGRQKGWVLLGLLQTAPAGTRFLRAKTAPSIHYRRQACDVSGLLLAGAVGRE